MPLAAGVTMQEDLRQVGIKSLVILSWILWAEPQ